jgi:lysophospholipase L1-like esterase
MYKMFVAAWSGVAALAVLPSEGAERPDPSRWESAIAAFESADRESRPGGNEVLFVGSSSIRLWDLKTSFPNVATINRGFGGSQIADVTFYADRIITPYRPRLVVLYAGDNDIAAGLTSAEVVDDFRQFLRVVRDQLPQTHVVYISIKPSRLRWPLYDQMKAANEAIEAIAETDENLTFVDVSPVMLGTDGRPRGELLAADGLHLSAAGYRAWTELVRPLLTNVESNAAASP